MNCPTCQTTDLRIADRQGIEIDYCPQCRGYGWIGENWTKLLSVQHRCNPTGKLRNAPPGTESAMMTITTTTIMGEGESAAPSWMTCLTSAEAIF
jgi:Zn-finger nucleic acid-binding protein